MRSSATAVKLGIVSLVLLLCTVLLVVIFGQLRFERYNTYSAEFSNGSGLRGGNRCVEHLRRSQPSHR